MFQKILFATLVAASCVAAPLSAPAAQRAIVITEPPPPPRHETIPPARRGHVWAPGHWAWRNGQHVWVAGHWIPQRHGHHWVGDRWVQRDGHWVLERGHWARGMREGEDTRRMGHRRDLAPMRDSDGDSVPDRYDSHPHNPRRY